MKQKIKKNPVISWIQKGKIPDNWSAFTGSSSKDIEASNTARASFRNLIGSVHNKGVMYATVPFIEAIIEAGEKLTEDKIWNIKDSYSGVLITHNFTFMYEIHANESGEHGYKILVFNPNGNFVASLVQNPELKTKGFLGNNKYVMQFAEELKKLGSTNYLDEMRKFLYTQVYVTLLFIRYAKVEEQVVKPRNKVHLQDCTYENDNDATIRIFNCTWFSELVKSEGFAVRGHFRMQACGEGRSDRELIWIDTFMKTGYTRDAIKKEYGNFKELV